MFWGTKENMEGTKAGWSEVAPKSVSSPKQIKNIKTKQFLSLFLPKTKAKEFEFYVFSRKGPTNRHVVINQVVFETNPETLRGAFSVSSPEPSLTGEPLVVYFHFIIFSIMVLLFVLFLQERYIYHCPLFPLSLYNFLLTKVLGRILVPWIVLMFSNTYLGLKFYFCLGVVICCMHSLGRIWWDPLKNIFHFNLDSGSKAAC